MKRTSGGHYSVRALPSSYLVTPDVLDGNERHHRRGSARTGRPNEVESARSRQGQSTKRVDNATSGQVLTENGVGRVQGRAPGLEHDLVLRALDQARDEFGA